MGLLDSLFSSNTYGGQGGLLDFLRTAQAQNDQYQPSAGFPAAPSQRFDAASFDPTTYAPSQPNNPIAVGGYQMPRIGNADQFQPQQAMTPPNAQPTQGQLPQGAPAQQPMQQPMQLPPALGGNGGGFNISNLGRAFNPDGLIARLTGNDSRSITQQNLKAQYDSLVPMLGPQKALLAVMNPEAGKTLINEALTNKEKYQVVSEDPFAGKKYGFVNEREQTVNGKPIDAQNTAMGSGSPLADMEKAKAAGVQGEALYDYLPKQIAPMVKAMIEGRQPLPSGAAMRNPATLALIDAAHSVDPTFDATSWGARAAGAKDFTSGKSSEMVRAANQTLAHVGSLLDSMDNLHNRSVPAWNYIANAANEATGGGQPGAFRTNAHAVAEEMSKVFKGANLSDSEIRHWEQNLSENMSPEQQKAQIAKLSELLHGSLAALEEKRLAAIGPMAAAKAGPVIKEEGQKVLERIDNWLKGNGGAQPASAGGIQEGATATNPQTGQKITFRNGKWQ